MEPKSGFKPLTSCIPGRRSSNLSYFGANFWCGRQDSNLR